MRAIVIGEFDLNTLRVDGNILNPERKSCGLKSIWISVNGSLVKGNDF